MKDKKIGLCITGSFCTFSNILPVLEEMCRENCVTVIMSQTAYSTDTRFWNIEEYKSKLRDITKNNIIHTITDAEPIGPKKLFDIILIAPCTGNTLAKLNWGITDTAVTMAAKAHIRNESPLVLAVSTNDALGTAAQNIGMMLNKKHIYFVPFSQDDCQKKPRSMIADLSLCMESLEAALDGKQLQPVVK
ncbi:MAG: dipicolinate synthase subunit B [Clostridiaceae bacterium]|nr:dipicolinate synthase subunit B [Clostridiaceae bacterium]